jgi:hypothetical protein
MQGLVLGDLTIDVEDKPGSLSLIWRGMSNSQNPAMALRPFFAVALAEATSRRIGLELHFEHLKHFNSSTVALLLQLIEQTRAAGVRIDLYYNGSQRWQAHSFEAIAAAMSHAGQSTVHRVEKGPEAEEVGHS